MKWSEIGTEGWEEKLSNGMSQLMREADEKIAEAVVLAGQKFKERANKNDQTNEAKPVEPQRIKGRWELLPGRDDEHIRYLHCSVCHFNGDYESNFCPNCGADMRGDEE